MPVTGEHRPWTRRAGPSEHLLSGWEGRRRASWIKPAVEQLTLGGRGRVDRVRGCLQGGGRALGVAHTPVVHHEKGNWFPPSPVSNADALRTSVSSSHVQSHQRLAPLPTGKGATDGHLVSRRFRISTPSDGRSSPSRGAGGRAGFTGRRVRTLQLTPKGGGQGAGEAVRPAPRALTPHAGAPLQPHL